MSLLHDPLNSTYIIQELFESKTQKFSSFQSKQMHGKAYPSNILISGTKFSLQLGILLMWRYTMATFYKGHILLGLTYSSDI